MLSLRYLESMYIIFCQEVTHFLDDNNLTDEEMEYIKKSCERARKNYHEFKKEISAVSAIIYCKE